MRFAPALAAFLAVLSLSAARAEDPRLLSARIATNLFARTCLTHIAEQAEAAKVASGELGMALLPPDMAVAFLMGMRGKAYSIAVGPAGFVLALPEPGLCLVYAQTADAVEMGHRFRAVMDDFSADTFELRQTGTTETKGRIGRTWDLAPTGDHLKKLKAKFGDRDFPPLFEVGLTTAPAGGLFEAVLSTAAKVVPKK